jgi:hypothetical protein
MFRTTPRDASGASNVSTTATYYIKMASDDVQAAMEKLEDEIGGLRRPPRERAAEDCTNPSGGPIGPKPGISTPGRNRADLACEGPVVFGGEVVASAKKEALRARRSRRY